MHFFLPLQLTHSDGCSDVVHRSEACWCFRQLILAEFHYTLRLHSNCFCSVKHSVKKPRKAAEAVQCSMGDVQNGWGQNAQHPLAVKTENIIDESWALQKTAQILRNGKVHDVFTNLSENRSWRTFWLPRQLWWHLEFSS